MVAIEQFYANHDSTVDEEEDIEVEEYIEEFFLEDYDGNVDQVSYVLHTVSHYKVFVSVFGLTG